MGRHITIRTFHLLLPFLHKVEVFIRFEELIAAPTVRTFTVIFLNHTISFQKLERFAPLHKMEFLTIETRSPVSCLQIYRLTTFAGFGLRRLGADTFVLLFVMPIESVSIVNDLTSERVGFLLRKAFP